MLFVVCCVLYGVCWLSAMFVVWIVLLLLSVGCCLLCVVCCVLVVVCCLLDVE